MYDAIIFPKNQLEKVFSNIYERCLPGISYITYKVPMQWFREQGWTMQEAFYFNFFRWENFYYHVFSQNIHPFGYLERQRADAFIRRMNTLLPGIKAPDWAQNWRRMPDMDFDSLSTWDKAIKTAYSDATPMPHANYPIYFSVANYLNVRYQWGWIAQRFFYNEELRGDYLHTGYFSKEDREAMDTFYGNTNGVDFLKKQSMTKEETEERKKNLEKWKALFEEFYPELKNLKLNPKSEKIDEPYFERNVKEIRDYMVAESWIKAMESNTFNQEELQKIYEFFLQERTHHFWHLSEEDGKYHATDLYNKFTKALNLPSVFELNKFTAKPIHHQYQDLYEIKNNITPYTVDNFRKIHHTFIKDESYQNLPKDLQKVVNKLISEEVFNPVFRRSIKSGYSSIKFDNTKSHVLAVISQSNNHQQDINKLYDAIEESKNQLHFLWSHEVKASFKNRLVEVVKSFKFVPNATITA
jgi:hypothetical protein